MRRAFKVKLTMQAKCKDVQDGGDRRHTKEFGREHPPFSLLHLAHFLYGRLLYLRVILRPPAEQKLYLLQVKYSLWT